VLGRAPRRNFSRAQLLAAALPESAALDRVVDAHLGNLRHKLAAAGVPGLIETVRGFGYRLGSRRRTPRASTMRRIRGRLAVAMTAVAVITATLSLPLALVYFERRLPSQTAELVERQIQGGDFDGAFELVVLAALAVGIGVGVGLLLAGRIARPLSALSTAARRLAHGDLAATDTPAYGVVYFSPGFDPSAVDVATGTMPPPSPTPRARIERALAAAAR
jgi:HAMP domain-containing protein